MCNAIATKDNRNRPIFFNSPYWVNRQLDDNFVGSCLYSVMAAADANDFFFIVFQNEADGPAPLFLYTPYREERFTEKDLKCIKDAAIRCAELGMIIELCPEIVTKHPSLRNICDGLSHFGSIVLIPYYHTSGPNNENELHGVFVGIRRNKSIVPLTEHAWARLNTIMSQSLLIFQEARDRGKIVHYDPQPLVDRHDSVKMLDMVRVLTRENFLEYVGTESDRLDTATRWLGFADPYTMHPKRLYKKLVAANDTEAINLTEETQKTATTLTSAALSQSCVDALHAVFGGITTVIPDAEQVYFVTTHQDFEMKIIHEQAHPLTPEEEKALIMVAQVTAVTGEAIFDTSEDKRLLFERLRKMIQQDVPIVAIPVYAWEVNKTGTPLLHGVFVAIRRRQAAEPTVAMRLAWTLAAQYLLSPLAAAHEKEPDAYKAVSIEQRIRFAYQFPAFPYVSHLYWLEPARPPSDVELACKR